MTEYTEDGVTWVEVPDKQLSRWRAICRREVAWKRKVKLESVKKVGGRLELRYYGLQGDKEQWPDDWPFNSPRVYDRKAWSDKLKKDEKRVADKLRRSRAKALDAKGVPISVVHNRIKHSEFDALLDAVEALVQEPAR